MPKKKLTKKDKMKILRIKRLKALRLKRIREMDNVSIGNNRQINRQIVNVNYPKTSIRKAPVRKRVAKKDIRSNQISNGDKPIYTPTQTRMLPNFSTNSQPQNVPMTNALGNTIDNTSSKEIQRIWATLSDIQRNRYRRLRDSSSKGVGNPKGKQLRDSNKKMLRGSVSGETGTSWSGPHIWEELSESSNPLDNRNSLENRSARSIARKVALSSSEDGEIKNQYLNPAPRPRDDPKKDARRAIREFQKSTTNPKQQSQKAIAKSLKPIYDSLKSGESSSSEDYPMPLSRGRKVGASHRMTVPEFSDTTARTPTPLPIQSARETDSVYSARDTDYSARDTDGEESKLGETDSDGNTMAYN